MKFYRSPCTDPRWNLALEEYVFERMDPKQSYFLLWQNHNTIVVGKNQNTAAEIDPQFVRERGITVVRRLSGGGAVYHDMGNLNFTFITDALPDHRIDLKHFCIPVLETLRSFGVDAQLSGRNDITVDGKKFSGNAQYLRRGRVMHHGTILFDSDLSVVGKALQADPEKIRSKGISSVRSRVTNLRDHLPPEVTLADFEARLLECLSAAESLSPIALTDEDLAGIEALRPRYDSWDWTYGRSPEYTAVNRRRVEGCGTVEVSLTVDEGRITALCFRGDFFGSGDPAELSAALMGHPCRREDVEEVLSGLDLSEYMTGITPRQLAEIIVE